VPEFPNKSLFPLEMSRHVVSGRRIALPLCDSSMTIGRSHETHPLMLASGVCVGGGGRKQHIPRAGEIMSESYVLQTVKCC